MTTLVAMESVGGLQLSGHIFVNLWPMFGGLLVQVYVPRRRIEFVRTGSEADFWVYRGSDGPDKFGEFQKGELQRLAERRNGHVSALTKNHDGKIIDGNFVVTLEDTLLHDLYVVHHKGFVPPNPFQVA